MELNQLRDATVATYPLPFAGGTIPLCKQSFGDRVAASDFLFQRRYARAERGTGTMPLTAEMRATMLAQIACTAISVQDLVTDSDARNMVLYLAAVRGGAKFGFEQFVKEAPAIPFMVVESALTWVCNLEDLTTRPTLDGSTTAS